MKISPASTENPITKQFKNDLIMNKMESKTNEMTMQSNNTNNLGAIDFQTVFSNNNSQFMPKCPLCEKTFANSSNLKHHMNTIHFNEAKWICNECGKVCTSKSNLKVHLRVHLRVKPYYCRWCDYNCMHHSSIRDHLSKCHPDKSHNSCEPGYIFNSTAVPEPELSHFEPNTSMHANNNLDLDDCKFQAKKIGNKMIASNNNKRGLLTDMVKEENELNEFSNQHYTNEEITNNIKKFKQDYELNKLKNKIGKKATKSNKFRGNFTKQEKIFSHNQMNMNNIESQQGQQNLDDSFQQNNDTYDPINTTYYSDDENNTSMDDTMNEQSMNMHCNNKNSSPSASISSSITNDSHVSSNSSKNLNLQNFQFLASNLNNANVNSNQQNEFLANILANLPNLDYQSKNSQETGPLNNMAAAVLQRLSTVALLQQFSNNNINNMKASQSNDDLSSLSESNNQPQTLKQKNGCGLDLSTKQPKKLTQRPSDTDTSDDFYSALSPVSTSSTNLSTSSLSSISKLKINEKSNNKLEKSPGESNNKKGILDVINRLKSQKTSPQHQPETTEISLKTDSKSTCLEHDLGNNGLDELNDLIKTHLLPISEAVFDKYKMFFDAKKSAENRDDEEYDEHDDNFHEAPMENTTNDQENISKSQNSLKKSCTFCNIFKNLIDLHELLHKT